MRRAASSRLSAPTASGSPRST